MFPPFPYCYDDSYYDIFISEVAKGDVFFHEICDFLRNIPLTSACGYWKPDGILKPRIYINADPKNKSNMYYSRKYLNFITENGKEAVLDIVEVTPDSFKYPKAGYYVLSVPTIKTKEDLPPNWHDEAHIWYVETQRKDDTENNLTMKFIDKISGFLTQDILERFALLMQLYRQGGLFID